MADRKKKLLFVSEALWIGGIETALVNLLNALDYDKYEVTCLILRAELAMAGRITPNCRLLAADRERTVSFPRAYGFSRLYHLTEESTEASLLHRCLMWAVPAVKWLENRLYIRYIRSCLQGESFDSCIIYSDRTAETAVRAVKADRFVLFYHHGAMRRVYHDEIGYRRAEKIVTVSTGLCDQLKKYRSKYGNKMITIPNLLDVDEIRKKSNEPIEEQFSNNLFHIVSCGRMAPEKGMDLAIEAAAMLRTEKLPFHWWLVGGGPEEEKLRKMISNLDLDEYVSVTGMKDNPYPYIGQANLYVQPSRVEAYGLTIMEALILGNMVVATETDGAREFACKTEKLLLCKACSNDIVRAIMLCINKQRNQGLPEEWIEQQNGRTLESICELF